VRNASGSQVAALLPLPPATFHILMALAAGDRHGYAILQDVASRDSGRGRLGAGTLYRSIQRMLEQGLIEESRRRTADGEDQRRRYYRLTRLGSAVAQAEAARMGELVELARGRGFAPEGA
jgi:DNA-binding PadR family transcriptional regulator